jgi:HEAT repeat protein
MEPMNRIVLLAGLVLILAGCGKSEPTLSGGKPIVFWVDALHAPDPRLRKEAAFKLGNAGPLEPAVYPAVVAALKDPDAQVRVEAVKALVKFGTTARDAVPALEEMQRRDNDARARQAAARALEALRD